MIVNDIAYGKIEIKNKLIIELINSKALQRLKGIQQHGGWKYILPDDPVTRLDHCIGVFHLLRHFGTSLEEQAAGLIHDVPHTAFSHVIDYVYGQRETMEHHESLHEKVVMNSELPEILKSHGMNVEGMLDHQNFPLLEKSIPNLCCDRLDYFFRDAVYFGVCTKGDVNAFLANLVVKDNEIMCKDASLAKGMSLAFLQCSRVWWASPLQAAVYELLAMAIKAGLQKSIISEDDLMLTDDIVYKKLKGSGDIDILTKLSLVKPGLKVEDNPKGYDFFTKTKARHIDPKTLVNGDVKRVSEIFPDFGEKIKSFKERIAGGYHIKILAPQKQF